MFVTLRLAAVGLAPPWIAAKLKVDGEIERIGDPLEAGRPYAEI